MLSPYFTGGLGSSNRKQGSIVETKGREDLNVPLKMARPGQWCADINRVQADARYDFICVDEESFEKFKPGSFGQLLEGFKEYKINPTER